MNSVIEKVKSKYPDYADVPDDELTRLIGQKHPDYLSVPDFKADFDRITKPVGGPAISFDPSLTPTPARSSEELAARNLAGESHAIGTLATRQHSSISENLHKPIHAFAKWIKGTTGQTWANAMDSLKAMAVQIDPDATAFDVETALEELGGLDRAPTGAEKIAAGVQTGVADTVRSFTSPIGIATLGLGAMPKAVQSTIATYFAVDMTRQLPEQAKRASEALDKGDTEAAAKELTGFLLTGTFAGLTAKHAVTSGKAAIADMKAEAAKDVGPATEAVISKDSPASVNPAVALPAESVVKSPAPMPEQRPELLTPEQWVASGRQKGTQWKVIYEAQQQKLPVNAALLEEVHSGGGAGYIKSGDIYRPIDLTLPPEKMELKELAAVASEMPLSMDISNAIRSHVGSLFDPAGKSLQELFANPELRQKLRTETEPIRDILRKRFGDTVTIYRAADPFPKMSAARTVFSWTLDPEIAAQHKKGAGRREIVKRSVPVDLIEWFGNPFESEVVINHLKLRQLDGLHVPEALAKKYGIEPPLVGLGAATPAEFALSPKTPTGIKNATVDQERVTRGLPPAMEPTRRSFGTVWDAAMAKIDADPGYTDRLVGELREKPRALTDLEDATVLHRQIELQNEYGKATRDLAQAFDDGRREDVVSEKARVAALSDQLLDLYNIGKLVGTETGRGLAARKMMAYEDFSLAKMELEKRAAKGGEQLTDAERAEVVRANAEIERTTKALEEHTSGAEDRMRVRETERAVTEAKASREPVEPLEDITGKLRDKFMAGEVEGITPLVQKLARYFVSQGVKERKALIEAVHEVVKSVDPTLTMRDTMDAISGYGKFRRLSKDEISVQLRDLKGQMQQVAKLEDMQANRPPRKTGTERRTPSDEERRLIRLVNEAKNKFQIPITDEATQLKSSLDTLKTRLRNQITDLEARIKNKDFEKKPKRFIQMDETAQKLHFEAAKVKARWMEALMKDRLARRSLPAKIIGTGAEVLNTMRAVLTSLDLSAVLRQGGFVGFGHPIRAARSFPAMFRALRSEAGQHAVNQEILSRKNYPLYKQSKLYLSEHGHKLSAMEEAYMSRWADKIPLVAASQRAYTTFLNKLRADSFDAMAATLSRGGELTPVEAKAIANFINVATGRGSLGATENAAVGLSTVFFSPRYVASRFQLLAGQPLYRGNARTRKLIAGEYGRYLAGVAVVYALAQIAGAEVETDPRSSDFGKLRFDNTRIDPMSGLLQSSVLMSRLATGETKQLSGKTVPIRGDVPFGGDDAADITARFLRTKLSPALGATINALSGTDVAGQPVTPESTAQNLLVPLALKDIYDTMIEQGVPRGTAMAILSIFGMGLQTYEER